MRVDPYSKDQGSRPCYIQKWIYDETGKERECRH